MTLFIIQLIIAIVAFATAVIGLVAATTTLRTARRNALDATTTERGSGPRPTLDNPQHRS